MAGSEQEGREAAPAPKESRNMAMLSNALAIIGFIILIVIVVWGLIHIVDLSGSSLNSLFTRKSKVEVTAPKNAVSGQSVNVSWKYTGKETGTFAFMYQCAQSFDFLAPANNAMTKIPCGTAINVGSSTSAMLMPKAAASSTAVITVMFTSQDGAKKAEGTASIAIAPSAQPPVTPPTTGTGKPTTKPSYTPTTRRPASLVTHAASGPADLSARIIVVGVMDPSGALISRMPTSPYDIVGVEFDIANVGGSATGSWYFTASLPTGGQQYPYTSPMQISLAPGEHIVSVLRFSPNQRPGIITVTADPLNSLIEGNETNNTITQAI